MKNKKILWLLSLLITCFLLASCTGKLKVYCPDLAVPEDASDKSGDCTLIVSPDNKVMLIDCGHPQSIKYTISLLTELKIKQIDCLVVSHPHIDHIGGIPALCAMVDVKKCYYTGLVYPTQTYQGFIDAMKNHNIPVEIIREGDSFSFGEKVKCDVFWPPKGEFEYPVGYPANSTQFVNDTSVCLKMNYGKASALFAGDLYRSAERKLVEKHKADLKSTFAKANHHGNDTSNSLGWIKAVDADVVYAMNDVLGSMQVYKDYTKSGHTKFYHSAENGVMRFSIDKKGHVTAKVQKTSWMQDDKKN